jgi:hypothetical protein
MESSIHSLTSVLPLFCNCQFRRLGSIQFLCSQAHILAESKLDSPRLNCCSILLNNPLQTLYAEHAENTASVVNETCLLIRGLASDVILLRVGSRGNVLNKSLPSNNIISSKEYVPQFVDRANAF